MELNKNEYYLNWTTVFKFPHSSSGQVYLSCCTGWPITDCDWLFRFGFESLNSW